MAVTSMINDCRNDGFFYGLFMDADVLSDIGIQAVQPRRAYVDGFALKIGHRATLFPTPGGRAYGMVFAVTDAELEKLYSIPGLEDYRSENVLAHSMNGDAIPALVYNLPNLPGPDEANEKYAARLKETLSKLGFPSEYIGSI